MKVLKVFLWVACQLNTGRYEGIRVDICLCAFYIGAYVLQYECGSQECSGVMSV